MHKSRATFLTGLGTILVAGCSGTGNSVIDGGLRKQSSIGPLLPCPKIPSQQSPQCPVPPGSEKDPDNPPPPTAVQDLQQRAQLIFPDAFGNPVVRTLAADGSATYSPLSGMTLVAYTSATYNQTLVNQVVASMRTYISSVQYASAPAEDRAIATSLVQSAQTALNSVVDHPSLQQAFDSVNTVVAAGSSGLIIIGSVTSIAAAFYLNIGMGSLLSATGPLAQDKYDFAVGRAGARPLRKTLNKIARAALKRYKQVTSTLPGTSNGSEACAKMIQLILVDVYGHEFTGAHSPHPPDDVWVPDLVLGLKNAGWTSTMSALGAQPGWIAVQNGGQDGGAPGDTSNPYMNHIGVIVNSPIDGTLQVLSNSSKSGKFNYLDSLQFPNIGYSAGQMGPTLFLIPPDNGQ